MDSLTHIAIGACLGEVFAGKKLGKKALLWGALAQSIPDIDFIAAAWSGTAENLLAHRGFTHSFLFAAIITPVMALLAERWHRPHNISIKKWMQFFGVQVMVHLLIDGMNVYGAGWFEPFSHLRVSYNWIYVADPFFSIWPGISLVLLLIMRKKNSRRLWWARFALVMSSVYLLYCGLNKFTIDRDVRAILAKQEIPYNHYFTTPTPLNNWLWYVVAATDSGFYIGYRSRFDKTKSIDFHFVPQQRSLLEPVADHEDLHQLIRFSKGYYTVEQKGGKLLFNDIRFGEQIGWRQPGAPFVFYYYLQHPDQNEMLVQRGRFAGWDRSAFISLLRRIKGE
jgi:inner membrane protein